MINNSERVDLIRRLSNSSGPVTIRTEGGTDLTGTASVIGGAGASIVLVAEDGKTWTIPISNIVAAASA